jgi:hypothetical protein
MEQSNNKAVVEVTLKEIYEAVLELKGIVQGHPDKLDDHEKRIRALEMKIWGISGLVGLVTFIASRYIP